MSPWSRHPDMNNHIFGKGFVLLLFCLSQDLLDPQLPGIHLVTKDNLELWKLQPPAPEGLQE